MEYSPDFFEKVLEICPDGVIGSDLEGNVFFVNRSAERLLGCPRDQVVGKVRISAFYPAGVDGQVRKLLDSEEYGGRGRLLDFETELVRRSGGTVPVRLSCSLLGDGTRETGIIGFLSDITARKASEREFLESETRFRTIVETAGDAIVTLDGARRITMANRAASELLGYAEHELTGMDFQDLIPGRYGDGWEQVKLYAASKAGKGEDPEKTVEVPLLRKSGEEIPVQMSIAEKPTAGGKVVTAIIRDISGRKAREEELRILSITDSLTRLYNRRHFNSLAQTEMERAIRNQISFSLLLADIDHFKKYNDAFGHIEGDRVLAETGELLLRNFRAMDTCYRFGGEEFLVLLPESRAEGAMIAAERLRKRFAGMEYRPHPEGGPVTLTMSIGLTEYRPGDTLEDLVRYADLAMYAAKNGGRNRTVCHRRPGTAAP